MTMALNALPLPPDDLKTNIGALYENLVGNQGVSYRAFTEGHLQSF